MTTVGTLGGSYHAILGFVVLSKGEAEKSITSILDIREMIFSELKKLTAEILLLCVASWN